MDKQTKKALLTNGEVARHHYVTRIRWRHKVYLKWLRFNNKKSLAVVWSCYPLEMNLVKQLSCKKATSYNNIFDWFQWIRSCWLLKDLSWRSPTWNTTEILRVILINHSEQLTWVIFSNIMMMSETGGKKVYQHFCSRIFLVDYCYNCMFSSYILFSVLL